MKKKMTKKIKAEIILKAIYEIDPGNYPKGSIPQECLDIDVANFQSQPEDFMLFDNIQVEGKLLNKKD